MREAFVEWQERFGHEGTGVLERLRAVAEGSGSITGADVRRVADELGWPVAAVAGAASFYADLTAPQGLRHVRVCRGTSCFVSSYGRNVAQVEAALGLRCGMRDPEGIVSLDGAYCLGHCYASPAALNGSTPMTGRRLGERLRSDTEAEVLAQPIPFRAASRQPVTLAGLSGDAGEWQVWPETVSSGDPTSVLAEVAAAGLRGRGGAEYPVAAKWRAVARGPAPRYVVVNGDEGDPGSYCDRLLMEADPHRVLEGLALACFAAGAHRGFVFVRSEYPIAVDRMRVAVAEARSAGHFGPNVHGTGFDLEIDVVQGAGSYVAGEETALLHALQGLRGAVRPRPPYPTSLGFEGHPTAVNNVETIATVPWVVRHGGIEYARMGTPEETGTKLVSLSERFARPAVYEVEFGTPLRDIVEVLGGGLRDDRELRAVQVGGPLGGFLAPDELDLPLLADALADAGVALGHGSLVAIDRSVSAPELLRHLWSFAAAESCGACTPCRVGSRRGLELAYRLAYTDTAETEHQHLLEVMGTGSLCAFGRGVAGSVRSLLRVFSHDFGSGVL
ncbi:NADH:ubiquinone oxidoreductase subunit F (NADH-binding) [Saccharopolyspora erythraea NRRL 2338]|uniref:NADH-quinone oxidoreductase chain F n=2 Tax=Saccharopolyspora erythraea TaxID=1836 RepID=A4FCF6_SACEN|nr:NAD(P)H-dependent oxidoreductase subunit E [Saccharopolyspora erythraea]PFG95494.1 NADH:ubiquinone oxidoreductase subunit F (NADH-binding) [Saccharopolyspora erythraea NRRL 2338]QRK92121.1 NAD(P)H-dependent oxidoreductase subunit E [Saccharopolyspora erythraea]CAM01731.1 NADH-quinone oxidoreductase chain F [Saccharopolyspora erythraea NRRL 2338]